MSIKKINKYFTPKENETLNNCINNSYKQLNGIKSIIENKFPKIPHIQVKACPSVVSSDPSNEKKIWQLVDSAPVNYGFNKTLSGATGSGPSNETLTQVK